MLGLDCRPALSCGFGVDAGGLGTGFLVVVVSFVAVGLGVAALGLLKEDRASRASICGAVVRRSVVLTIATGASLLVGLAQMWQTPVIGAGLSAAVWLYVAQISKPALWAGALGAWTGFLIALTSRVIVEMLGLPPEVHSDTPGFEIDSARIVGALVGLGIWPAAGAIVAVFLFNLKGEFSPKAVELVVLWTMGGVVGWLLGVALGVVAYLVLPWQWHL
jgi:hypothetical protein